MIKKVIVLLMIIMLIISTNVFAAFTKVTIEELKTYLETILKDEELYKSISIQDNTILIESEDNQVVKLFYDNVNNILYSEETFDNTMSSDDVAIKVGQIATMPFYSFFAVAEKNGVEKKIYEAYVKENGLQKSAFLELALGNLSPNIVDGLDNKINTEFENTMNMNCDYYSIKWEKVKEDSKITIKHSLIMNSEADFSIMKDKIEDKTIFITKENADYSISVKVGETYSLNLEEKCTGYSFDGGSCIEFNKDEGIIKGEKVGISYGILNFGEEGNQTQKTIYIEVVEDSKQDDVEDSNQDDEAEEENKDSEEEKQENKEENKNPEIETDTDTDTDKKDSNEEDKKENEKKDDTTSTNTKLPQTGINYNFLLIISLVFIISCIIGIKFRKYKDIK